MLDKANSAIRKLNSLGYTYDGVKWAAPQAPSGQQAEPTDEQIIDALKDVADEVILRYHTQDVVDAGRAVLAVARHPSEPEPAGQADMRQALSDLRYAVNARPSCQANVIERCRCLDCSMLRSYDVLVASQAERTAVKEDKA